MEEHNEQFVFGQVEKNIRLSHKLLHAFNEKHHSLESKFLCLSCNGISINPLFCKKCGYSYCQLCLLVLSESNVTCLCRKSSKANFEPKLEHGLQKTKYWVQDGSGFSKMQITYLEASSYTKGSPYNFLSIYNYDLSNKGKERYNIDCRKLSHHLTNHKQKFDCRLALKKARLINFYFAKGYSLELKSKVLCKYDAIFLGVLHLRKIEFNNCLYNFDFSLSFCQSIRFNLKRIETFYIYFIFKNEICYKTDFKSCFIILNTIQFCTKITYLRFEPEFYESESNILFPKSFYNFLSTFYVLKAINFINLTFDDNMNLNSFKSLIFLQTLKLVSCCFHNKFLFYSLLDNIPNLNELMLSANRIKCNPISTNINESNFKLKKTIKFSPILRTKIWKDNYIEKSIFHDLIQFDKIKMKYIQIYSVNKILIPNFIDFLKCSNLQYLAIDSEVECFNFDEFCNYLRNSQFLIGLKFIGFLIDTKYRLLLQAISVNKSIKVLFFKEMDLSNCSFDLINLILTNLYITTLILGCYIRIDLDFVKALSKNKTLLYLNIIDNRIEEEHASKLSNLNLKGINVKGCAISKESEELIYQKIARKEFPWDLLFYENFLI